MQKHTLVIALVGTLALLAACAPYYYDRGYNGRGYYNGRSYDGNRGPYRYRDGYGYDNRYRNRYDRDRDYDDRY